MTSRELVQRTLRFEPTDRVPVDLGGSLTSGIHAKALNGLIRELGLPERLIKVYEPMMFLGQVDLDVRDALKTDVLGINNPNTMLGYFNKDWKEWTIKGDKYLFGGGFFSTESEDGITYAHTCGSIKNPATGKMLSTAYFFDPIARQEDLTNHIFDGRKDYQGMYSVYTDEECRYIQDQADYLYANTDASLFGNFFTGGFGDAFHIPCPWMIHTPGIRKLEDWMMAHYDEQDYIKEFYQMQLEVVLENLKLYKQAVGNKIDVIAVSGTDFGTQASMFISPNTYREIYKPLHKIVNDWIHKNTSWKTWYHSCGSIEPIIEDLIEIGVDALNPIQLTAHAMDADSLVDKFGGRVVFWGGGINTQWTLQYGTEEEVREETKENVKKLSSKGGFVAAAVHNIQSESPAKNIVSFLKNINEK